MEFFTIQYCDNNNAGKFARCGNLSSQEGHADGRKRETKWGMMAVIEMYAASKDMLVLVFFYNLNILWISLGDELCIC